MSATKERRERGFEMLRNGMTTKQVAEETGACIASVRRWARAVRDEAALSDFSYFRNIKPVRIEMVSPGEWECSGCGGLIDWDSYDDDDPPNCNYCPNCGAKVTEVGQ